MQTNAALKLESKGGAAEHESELNTAALPESVPQEGAAAGGLLHLSGDVERSEALAEELLKPCDNSDSAAGVALQQVKSGDDSEQVQTVTIMATEQTFGSFQRSYQLPKEESEPLVPTLFADLGNNFFTYFLCVVLCALALFKVYQVQQTRDLTAQLNETVQHNKNLESQWLVLVKERQSLSEHGRVRKAAVEQLQMRAPKTDAELLISVGPQGK